MSIPDEAVSTRPPTAEHLANVAAELTALLADAVVETAAQPGAGLWVRINVANWRECAEKLLGAGFDYFGFLSAIDWSDAPEGRYEYTELDDPADPAGPTDSATPTDADGAAVNTTASTAAGETLRLAGGETRFQMLLSLHSRKHKVTLTIKADLPDSPESTFSVETIRDVFLGADWHEREAHEMFGIGFDGHPNLQPIYLPTDFEGNPLRKDFPLLAREVKPWPGVVDIEEIPESLQEQLEAEVMADFEASLAEQN